MSDKKIIALSSICVILLVVSLGTLMMLYQKDVELKSQVSRLQSEIMTLNDGVKESFNEGYAEGEEEGYQKGYVQGVDDGAGRGWNLRDPTYAEAIAFIESDKTNEREYYTDYLCWNYVADFKNNAFKAGYRAGNVYIEFPESAAHAITCFNTTDKGLIFVEPQDDHIVTLSIGESYWDRNLYEVGYDDTILRYDVIW